MLQNFHSSATRLKVGTWNLARPVSSARRKARIDGQLAAVDADVWVLTETHDAVVPGDDYRSVSTSGVDRSGHPGERWVTIWSRFPLEPLPATADPVRAVATRIMPPEGVPLVVYGTVLPWLGSPWRGIDAAGGRAFAAALEAQAADWNALRASHPDHDLIVAGDFNQDLAETHYYGSRPNRELLVAALHRAGLKALTAGAADPVRAGSAPSACIDHICLSAAARWRVGGLRRWPDLPKPDRRLSDHFGIVADLELAGHADVSRGQGGAAA